MGFAYAPTSDTVIRGGFGLYYDQILGAVVSQSRNVYPTFSTVNFGGGALTQNGGDLTLFNPRNAVFDPVRGLICPRDLNRGGMGCNNSERIPFIQPGTLNVINPALTPARLLAAL